MTRPRAAGSDSAVRGAVWTRAFCAFGKVEPSPAKAGAIKRLVVATGTSRTPTPNQTKNIAAQSIYARREKDSFVFMVALQHRCRTNISLPDGDEQYHSPITLMSQRQHRLKVIACLFASGHATDADRTSRHKKWSTYSTAFACASHEEAALRTDSSASAVAS